MSQTHAASVQCRNKSRMSEKDAWAIANRMRHEGQPVHAYFCVHCCRYHVGSDERLARKMARGQVVR